MDAVSGVYTPGVISVCTSSLRCIYTRRGLHVQAGWFLSVSRMAYANLFVLVFLSTLIWKCSHICIFVAVYVHLCVYLLSPCSPELVDFDPVLVESRAEETGECREVRSIALLSLIYQA